MKILISGNNHFCKTFKTDIPRPLCSDPKKVGRLVLNSHSERFVWQCSILKDPYDRLRFNDDPYYIAVEANSRLCIFIPESLVHDQKDFEHYLVTKIVDQAMISCQLAGIDKLTALQSIESFDQKIQHYEWIKNTDMSVSGAITDMEFWLHACIDEIGHPPKGDELLDLEIFLNERPKKIKISDKPVRRKTVLPFQTFFDFWQHNFIKEPSEPTHKTQEKRKKQRNNVVPLFPEK